MRRTRPVSRSGARARFVLALALTLAAALLPLVLAVGAESAAARTAPTVVLYGDSLGVESEVSFPRCAGGRRYHRRPQRDLRRNRAVRLVPAHARRRIGAPSRRGRDRAQRKRVHTVHAGHGRRTAHGRALLHEVRNRRGRGAPDLRGHRRSRLLRGHAHQPARGRGARPERRTTEHAVLGAREPCPARSTSTRARLSSTTDAGPRRCRASRANPVPATR